MLVEHAQPHCESHQFYNGILDGKSHGVFHGRIIVHKDAQKTDAKQTNRNLLLSDDAQIDTKPQLEIYADDVKCTHGATIGQIEENALFYLRSRGIDERSARKLLLMAFANECLDRMKEESVRNHVEGLINSHLFAMANRQARCESWAVARAREEIGRKLDELPQTAFPGSRVHQCTNVGFDVEKARRDFPILQKKVYGQSAGLSGQRRDIAEAAAGDRRDLALLRERTTPTSIAACTFFPSMPQKNTKPRARTVQDFLNAADEREIIFVRGATEAINLVAQSYGRTHVGAGDEVLITAMEHHSNIVPWQMLCEEKGATLRVAPINERGELLLDELPKLLTPKTKLVAVTHVSNALGTHQPDQARLSRWRTA